MNPAIQPPSAPNAKLPRVLWPLLFGNFVIGAGVMVVPGTLSDISQSLKVSVAAAGQLITVSAILMCLGAPLFASLVAGWDRRRLLTTSMLWYAVMIAISAAMPGFGSLIFVRALAVASPAIFTPQAAACVAMLVPPEQRGRAITFVFLGWSVASVAGMPMGAWIGGTWGWRSAFALVALLSLISAFWVWRALPNGIRPPAFSRAAWGATFRSPPLTLTLCVTLLCAAGQFVLFSYFAPYFKAQLKVSPLELSLLLAWFGLFGLVGNILISRYIDRLGAPLTVMLCLCCIAVSLLLWPLGTKLATAALLLIPWGLGCFASNSSQQARLVGIAPALAGGSVALNTSAIYAGQAIGAASGGWLIANGQMQQLHWYGLVGLLIAMTVSQIAAKKTRAHTAPLT